MTTWLTSLTGPPCKNRSVKLGVRRALYEIESLERRALLSDVGNIFVANSASHGVSETSTDGKLIDRSVIAGVGDAGIAVSGDDLFIVNKEAGTVGEYNTAGGTVNSKLITRLIGPDFITIGGGHIFVADDFDSRIGEYTLTGTPVGVGLIEGISSVEGIAANSTDLFVMIAPANSNAIIAEYNAAGGVVNPALVTGVLCNIGQSSLTLSGSDLFATDRYIGNIAEYTTAGATVGVPFSRDLNLNSDSIAVTGSNVYVIQHGLPNGSGGSIGVYTTSGQTVSTSLISGNPTEIATDGSTLFLLNRGGGVSEYTLDGAPVSASVLPSPTYNGIAVLGSDLFLTDTQAGTIAEYSTSGAIVNPALVTGLNSPGKLTVFGDRIFVADAAGVGEYTTAGQTINPTLIAEQYVSSVHVFGSNLLVADGDTIGEFSMTGATINPALVVVGSAYDGAQTSSIVDFTVSGNDLFVATGEYFIVHPSANFSGVVAEFTTSGKQVNPSLATSESFFFGGVVAFGSSFYVSDDQFGNGYTINGTLFQTGIVSQYSFAGAPQSTVSYVVNADGQPTDSICIEPATVGPATQLVVIQPPTAVVIGSPMNPPIIVALEDSNGNIVTDNSSTITLTPSNGASVAGTLSQPATGGVAIFSDLTFPSAGSYTLTASGGALTAAKFTLTAAVLPTTVVTSSTVPTSTIGLTLHGRVTVTLTNNAPTAEKGLVFFRIYASTDGQINPGTVIATRRQRIAVKPGGHVKVKVFVGPLSVDLPGGSYTLLAQCTSPDGLTSSSTSGPVVKIAPPVVDFQVAIASASVPATLIASKRASAVIQVAITNSGNIPSHGRTTIIVYLYQNGGEAGNTTLVQRTSAFRIRPGKTVNLKIPLRAIPKLPAGAYTLVVDVVDADHDGSSATYSPVTVLG